MFVPHKGDPEGRKRIQVAAAKLAIAAAEGDLPSIIEVRNTLDGRPAQQVALTGADGGPVQLEARAVAEFETGKLRAIKPQGELFVS